MKPARLSTNFVPYTDADFRLKAAHILESMEGNSHFPDPIPTLQSIRILYDAYVDALEKAMGMDRIAVTIKNDTRKKLAHELGRLSLYVMYIADGNTAILTSSGFTLTKTPQASQLGATGSVTITNGISSGQLTGSVKAVKGAKTYIHQITDGDPAEAGVWQKYTSTKRSYTFTQLTPGTHYFIKVTALGTGNQVSESPVADQWAQ